MEELSEWKEALTIFLEIGGNEVIVKVIGIVKVKSGPMTAFLPLKVCWIGTCYHCYSCRMMVSSVVMMRSRGTIMVNCPYTCYILLQLEGEVVPVFTESLHDVTVERGSVAVMSCRVTGQPRPTVTWRGPDQSVITSSRIVTVHYFDDGTALLQVSTVHFISDSKYRTGSTDIWYVTSVEWRKVLMQWWTCTRWSQHCVHIANSYSNWWIHCLGETVTGAAGNFPQLWVVSMDILPNLKTMNILPNVWYLFWGSKHLHLHRRKWAMKWSCYYLTL